MAAGALGADEVFRDRGQGAGPVLVEGLAGRISVGLGRLLGCNSAARLSPCPPRRRRRWSARCPLCPPTPDCSARRIDHRGEAGFSSGHHSWPSPPLPRLRPARKVLPTSFEAFESSCFLHCSRISESAPTCWAFLARSATIRESSSCREASWRLLPLLLARHSIEMPSRRTGWNPVLWTAPQSLTYVPPAPVSRLFSCPAWPVGQRRWLVA